MLPDTKHHLTKNGNTGKGQRGDKYANTIHKFFTNYLFTGGPLTSSMKFGYSTELSRNFHLTYACGRGE